MGNSSQTCRCRKRDQPIAWAVPPDENEPCYGLTPSPKLNYLHESSLRKRLKELVAKHRAILESLIGPPEAFSAAVADRRNQLTHASEQNQGAADDYRTLWVLCDKMALLLEACFLDEIDFTHERLKQIVTTRSNRARSVHQGWV